MIRGEIWWADFGYPLGSEPGFKRPVIIVQADSFNRSRINTCLVIPITTNLSLADAPGNVSLEKQEALLPKKSVAVVSQLTVIDRIRLEKMNSMLPPGVMKEIEVGIHLVLDLNSSL